MEVMGNARLAYTSDVLVSVYAGPIPLATATRMDVLLLIMCARRETIMGVIAFRDN